MKKHFGLATAVVVCVSAGAFGAVSWTNPNGLADNFDWNNGQNSDTNYFDSPLYFGGDELWFFSNFDVSSPGGDTSKADTLDVDLTAKNSMKFTNVEILVYGDYSITDPNQTGLNSVKSQFDMTGTKLGHGNSPWSDGFVFTTNVPAPPATPWNDSAALSALSVAFPDVTDIHMSVTGSTLVVSDGQGGTAAMTANIQWMQMKFTLIPEPASLALLALGGLVALRRRC